MKTTLYKCAIVAIAALWLPAKAAAQQALSLNEAKQLAVTRNNNLKAAQQRIEAAQAQKALADAKNKPTVDGAITGWYVGAPLNKLLPEYGVSPSVSITQPIYAGGKIKMGRELAAKGVEITKEQKGISKSH